ncbi:hypothetical protein I5I61_18930 [Pseudomonas nitroreducens]|uniref:Tail assembly chaperone n=1 Tax=Pseudomonas nitroreducens TaxID=46680 RepID=A0ABS0KQ55_PSENT|nr:phage tail assembly chaperone [Pseudomonas nitroreducens]MBG6289532.1 hypothetical protein [Pseudomonas nitroreducens]
MAGKFKIDQDPTFSVPVSIDRAGGKKIDVGFTFKYRTQKEVAAMLEAWDERRKKAGEELEGRAESLSMEERVGLKIVVEAQEVADLVLSWDFDDEFGDASIQRLLVSVVTAIDSIKKAYFEGLNPARLGN